LIIGVSLQTAVSRLLKGDIVYNADK